MHVAVTGATGFIGRYLVPHLIAQGHSCRAWYRSTSRRDDFPSQIEWVTGELGDSASAAQLVHGCDAVIHAALDRPGPGFRGAEGEIPAFAQRNIIGSLQLIEAAKNTGVKRFVLVSTCAVHEQILDDRPLDELHPCTPLTHYGAHKAALEMFVHSYGWGESFPICALRPTGVYGIAAPVEQSKWFPLVRDVVAGESVTCQRGGKEVHAYDVARAAELLLHVDGTAGECFNCYDQYISQFDVATLAKQISGSDATISGQVTAPKHQIETSKLKRLGMKFGGAKQLEQTVSQLVEYNRQQVNT